MVVIENARITNTTMNQHARKSDVSFKPAPFTMKNTNMASMESPFSIPLP
jgi:hypothetical protein